MAAEDQHGLANDDRDDTRNEKAAARVESSDGLSRTFGADGGVEGESKARRRLMQVWQDNRLTSPSTLSVLLVLAIEMDRADECSLTQEEFARLARVGVTSLNKHLDIAEPLGYFRRDRGQGRSSTRYIATGAWME